MLGYGFKIKVLRDRLGLTQKEMSELLAVNIETVRRWEQNKKIPSLKNMIIINFLMKNCNKIKIVKDKN